MQNNRTKLKQNPHVLLWLPERFLQDFLKGIPEGHSVQFQEGSRKVPAIPDCSRTVPGLFRLLRACIFVSPLPSPRDWNPTDSLLGLVRDTPVRHSCAALLQDSLERHSRKAVVWNTLAGHWCNIIDTLVKQICTHY